MKSQTPRYRRLDLINSMPSGEQKRIALIVGCSRGHVSAVLNGYRSQENPTGVNIIRLAERIAAKEWIKSRKSKFKKTGI